MPQEQLRIEAFRGLAAVLVVMTHYAPTVTDGLGLWILGGSGVILFFVLSGFVFAPHFDRPFKSYTGHLLRRAFRIYPLYLCALLLYVALHAAPSRWEQFWPHVAMMHTLGAPEVATFYNGAFWSLPPEVEFYLFLPVLVWVAQRCGLSLFFTFALVLHAGLNIGGSVLGFSIGGWGSNVVSHLPACLLLFLLGVVAARAAKRLVLAAAIWRCALSALGLALLAAIAGYLHFVFLAKNPIPIPVVLPIFMILLFCGVAYALLLAAVCVEEQPTANESNQLATHPIWDVFATWCGRLSYGVYLFHAAAATLISRWCAQATGWTLLAQAVALTLVLAAIGHVVVERPMRELGRGWARGLQK